MFQVRGAVTPTIAFAVLTASSNHFIGSVGASFGGTTQSSLLFVPRGHRSVSSAYSRGMDRTIMTTPLSKIKPTSNHACVSSALPDDNTPGNDMTQDEKDDGTQPNRMACGLIDVDCNLMHSDMMDLGTKFGLLSSSQEPSEEQPLQQTIEEYLNWILTHPSTQAANIRGMLVPSSNLKDARLFLNALEHSISASSLSSSDNHNDSQTSSVLWHTHMPIQTTVGVHPYDVLKQGDCNVESLQEMRELIALGGNRVVAVGECGLDYSEGFPSPHEQRPWFEAQVSMAVELHQNLFLHERLAFEDTTHILDSSGISPSKVIVHCFTGTMEECRQYVERGYWLSVSGWICRDDNNNNNDDDGAAKNVVRQCLVDGILPLERLMVETDAPYMGFGTCRDTFFQQEDLSNLKSKKRKQLLKSIYPNVPSALPLVVQTVVDAINEGRLSRNEEPTTFAQVATMTTANAIEFFSFPTPL